MSGNFFLKEVVTIKIVRREEASTLYIAFAYRGRSSRLPIVFDHHTVSACLARNERGAESDLSKSTYIPTQDFPSDDRAFSSPSQAQKKLPSVFSHTSLHPPLSTAHSLISKHRDLIMQFVSSLYQSIRFMRTRILKSHREMIFRIFKMKCIK